jgi:hypothetical protein
MNGGFLLDGLPHDPLDRRHVAHPTHDPLSTDSERLREQGGNPTFVEAKIDVARTHGQPIPLSDCRAHVNRHPEIEIVHKLPNQRCLLVIFLAEQSQMGLHDSEEFRHHRGDAGEVMRPGLAFPSAAEPRHRHGRLEALGIHIQDCGFKTDIHPFLAA